MLIITFGYHSKVKREVITLDVYSLGNIDLAFLVLARVLSH